MARIDDLSITINASFHIPKETVETCLRLVEIYMNDTGELLMCDRQSDGSKHLYFKPTFSEES